MNMNIRFLAFSAALSMVVLACSLEQVHASQVGVWNFDNNLDNAIAGGASMAVVGGWTPTYVSETIDGSSATVLSFPAMSSSQALDMPNEAGPNGGSSTTTNIWSIVMDVKFPVLTSYTALWEAQTIGTTDADYFIKDESGVGAFGSIGTSGEYGGSDFDAGFWTRIAVTIDTVINPATYTVIGYVDGAFSMWSTTSSPPNGKEAVEAFLHLFTDDGDETAAGLVNSVAFYDEVLTEEAILLLGGATASGIPISATPTLNADFDEDNDVDGHDFLIWQRGFGIDSGATHGQGDADENEAVNAADLTVWQTQFGGPPPLPLIAAVSVVPEPTGLGLSFLFLLGTAAMRWRRCRG